MEKNNNKIRFLLVATIGFLLLCLLLFSKNLGNYWDWLFPYFRDGFKNNLFSNLFAWRDDSLGAPLSYASSFFFNIIFQAKGLLFSRPEIYQTFFLAIIATASFLPGYLLINTKNKYLNFLFAVMFIFNPAIFYKFLAGHLIYLFSYSAFLWLIYFLFKKFDGSLSSYLILALLIVLTGSQIQFLVFASILLLVYFFLNREKFKLKSFMVFVLLFFLMSLPWLSNFMLGADTIQGVSNSASSVAFDGSMHASFLRIILMTFSSATITQYVFSKWMLIYFGLFAGCLGVLFFFSYIIKNTKYLSKSRLKDKELSVTVWCLIIFTVLSTGFFHQFQIPVLKVFYPMFREIGHFAPIVVLFEILFVGLLLPYIITPKWSKAVFAGYLIGFIAINFFSFYTYLPKLNFEDIRGQFLPFKSFIDQNGQTSRVITYPFWNQYGFNNVNNIEKEGRLLNNSGWDSFIAAAGLENVSNYQAGGQSIDNTLQYNLLKTKDISELEKRNVKYIFDFQNIYTSNLDRYTTPETFDNNISLIKNDSDFITNLVAQNYNKIQKISDNIYEIKSTLPRIFIQSNSSPKLYFEKINPTEYKVKIKGLRDNSDLVFLENYNRYWNVYLDKKDNNLDKCPQLSQQNLNVIECKIDQSVLGGNFNLVATEIGKNHTQEYDYANKWELNLDYLRNLAKNNKAIKINDDNTVDISFELYFWPQAIFIIASIISLVIILGVVAFLLYNSREKNVRNT